jgi:hypothetical protein
MVHQLRDQEAGDVLAAARLVAGLHSAERSTRNDEARRM